jgi:hypothetical protein
MSQEKLPHERRQRRDNATGGQPKTQPSSDIPTVPDLEGPAPRYDEPELNVKRDQMPSGTFKPVEIHSRATLRLQIEELLQRREPAPSSTWQELGDDAVELLLQLLDDTAIQRQEALRQRVIATLGQLNNARAVPRLGQLLLNAEEPAITRTYAASALGRIESAESVALLGQAVVDQDEMVRRQVALALGRSRDPRAVPYLLTLTNDKAGHVAEAAATQVRAYQNQLRLDIDLPGPAESRGVAEQQQPLPEE